MDRTLEELLKEIGDRIFYRYADLNGEIQYPNTYEGDVMRMMMDAVNRRDEISQSEDK